MSGHSKWAQIKHQKAAADKKKGQLFSKHAREITIAAKTGGKDPQTNYKLRLAMERAKDAGMTKDAMERAVRRGTGEDREHQIEEVAYEGYGPGGAAFLIEVATDNKNRTTSEIRHIFTKHGGTLTPPGSTAYLFGAQIPKIELPAPTQEQVKKLIEELEDHEDVLSVHTNASI